MNPADPTFERYLMEWIEFYVRQIGIDGIFWDSGLQPLPPDFGNKPYLTNPGRTGPAFLELYERLYRYGRSLSTDFFMWGEGMNVDARFNAFAVDSKDRPETFRHAQRLAHAGPRRLVWRSAWPHDLSSGFPFIDPPNDVGMGTRVEDYNRIANDPMNRWICQLVRERGCRRAIGLEPGVSRLDEYIVVSPGTKGTFLLSEGSEKEWRLINELNHMIIRGEATSSGIRFYSVPAGPWRLYENH